MAFTLKSVQCGPYWVDMYPNEKTGYLDETSGIHGPQTFSLVPRTGNPVVVSARPLVVSYPSILTPDECEHLINVSRARMKHSVIGDTERVGAQNQNRTSTSAYLDKDEDPIVSRIESRMAYLIGVPRGFIERLQVIRYTPGQEYKAHWDSNGRHNPDAHGFSKSRGFQRVHTILAYLSTPSCTGTTDRCSGANGVTLFPILGVGCAPVAGDAIYWRNADDTLEQYDEALHQGLPVCCEEKWALNVWVHEKKLDNFGAFLEDLGGFRAAIDKDRAGRGLPATAASSGMAAIDHVHGGAAPGAADEKKKPAQQAAPRAGGKKAGKK